jgi:hypothetical protein
MLRADCRADSFTSKADLVTFKFLLVVSTSDSATTAGFLPLTET